MKRTACLIAVLFLMVAKDASAQGTRVGTNGDFSLIMPQEPLQGERSPGTAFALSVLGSAVPVGVGLLLPDEPGNLILVTGATVGPSLGHFYADHPGRAWLGIGIRLAALGVTLAAASTTIMETQTSSADGIVVFGTVLFCASGIIDIATAPASANAKNRELEEHRFELMGSRLRSSGDYALGLKYRF